MPTNAQDVAKYLEFSLLQLGAESYLHDKNFANQGDVVTAWKFGFNDASHEFIQRQAGAAGADADRLPGYNRMVERQAVAMFNAYEVIDHHANDSTGFSATLYRHRTSGEYTLSMRSTEARPWGVAGDAERDNEGANKSGIYERGFAFAQLATMNDYWSHIRAGQAWNRSSGTWETQSSGKLADFRTYMDQRSAEGAASAKKFNVTGYSLAGHLATAFTLMHEPDVSQAYTFNGAGPGVLRSGDTTGATIAQMLQTFATVLRNPAQVTNEMLRTALGLSEVINGSRVANFPRSLARH